MHPAKFIMLFLTLLFLSGGIWVAATKHENFSNNCSSCNNKHYSKNNSFNFR